MSKLFKAVARTGQKKVNYIISVTIDQIGATSIPKDQKFEIVWKRGPETQTSKRYDISQDPVRNNARKEVDETMTKVSSFYKKKD